MSKDQLGNTLQLLSFQLKYSPLHKFMAHATSQWRVPSCYYFAKKVTSRRPSLPSTSMWGAIRQQQTEKKYCYVLV